MARIFLCHASEDKAPVREVYQQLNDLGFTPWLDEKDILPGQPWNTVIEEALKTSDFVMVFLSTRSVEKVGYVQREFRRALCHAEEMPADFIYTIPVKLDACAVPSQFNHLQWVNLYEDGTFERIVDALHHGLQQRGQPLPKQIRTDNQTLTNSIDMEFVLIPAGTFMMGAPDSDTEAIDGEKPAHHVTISQPFYLGKCPG